MPHFLSQYRKDMQGSHLDWSYHTLSRKRGYGRYSEGNYKNQGEFERGKMSLGADSFMERRK